MSAGKHHKVTRVYTADDGETYFEDLTIPLHDNGPVGALSEAYPVALMMFTENPPGYDWDFHNAPTRQFVVLLDGGVEIEVSSGEKRVIETGEVVLVEDTTGKGHRTRNLEKRTRKSLFITLEDH